MSKPRVMIYTPMNPRAPRVWGRTLRSIFELEWGGPADIVFGREDAGDYPSQRNAYLNVTDKYNRAREMTLDGGYDALLTVEADMVLPPLALERLTRVEADVAYGLYVSRHGIHQWLAYHYLDEESGNSLSYDRINAEEAWGQVVETQGVGLGCTLIWRHVLEAIPFRCDDPNKLANDWYFALDCKRIGYVQKHDLGVVCGHISAEPSPRIYWPDVDADHFYREEFLTPPVPVQRQEITIDHFGVQKVYAMEAEQWPTQPPQR